MDAAKLRNGLIVWLRRGRALRRYRTHAVILWSLQKGDRFAYDLIRRTGWGSATVYVALAQLEADRAIDSHWDETWNPPRRAYSIRESA